MAGDPAGEHPGLSAARAGLRRLQAGNLRFRTGRGAVGRVGAATLTRLAEGQTPFATILGCSDSRVPPELVFDQGFGDLFIVRVAGNVVSAEVMGSLQYAGAYLRTPLFVVLGHEGCGAVAAALAARFEGIRVRSRVARLLRAIVPGLSEVEAGRPPARRLADGVTANVRWSVRQLAGTPEARRAVAERRALLVGAVYALRTGRVRFLGRAAGG
jgi:carbonic anhydrase